MKIYTKSGDGGTTSLIGGEQVSKADQRVEAYGTVDELSASLGYLSDLMSEEQCLTEFTDQLHDINVKLMWVEAELASIGNDTTEIKGIDSSDVEGLESNIDRIQATLEPIASFTIPGGNRIYSYCNVCRAVCRRAEREAIRIDGLATSRPSAIQYLNRLSDYLYVLGRVIALRLNIKEIYWRP